MLRDIINVYDGAGSHTFEPKKPGDVGHDLVVAILREDQTLFDRLVSFIVRRRCLVVMPVVGVRTIRSGIHLVMSDRIWAEVRPRSSTSRKKLHVLGGTIDSGYRGEMFTVLHNLGFKPRLIMEGERYAQVVFYSAIRPVVRYIKLRTLNDVVAQDKKSGGRGATGFGSTGA